MKYYAIGYHGTTEDGADTILNSGIDFSRREGDVFLGRGFYVWRDSCHVAKDWKNSKAVLEVKIECPQDEMLNFTSRIWNNENDIIALYLEYFLPKNIYFGEFIDFLIANDIDIKLITVIDLKTKNKTISIPIQDPLNPKNKTIFSYGDIQLCIKHQDIVSNLREVDDES